jgi:hypothetical protein
VYNFTVEAQYKGSSNSHPLIHPEWILGIHCQNLRGRCSSPDALNRNLFKSCSLSRNSFQRSGLSLLICSSGKRVDLEEEGGSTQGGGRERDANLNQSSEVQRRGGEPHLWRQAGKECL